MSDGPICTKVDPNIIGCRLEDSVYGYYPNLGANAFFAAIFGICCIANIFLGIKYKTWTYMIAVGVGCFAETLGYVGRIMLHNNPFDDTGFNIQICCLIIAPAFITAGVYLTLKYLVLTVGRDYSRIRAKFYTWIFILCDLLSLILQGAGGGIAATANTTATQDIGNNLMMAGISWQVATLLVFGILVADYVYRAYSSRNSFTQATVNLLASRDFKLFAASIVLSFLVIFTRCVFRIAEMAGGWANPIMQDEAEFIVLDGVMVTVASLCLTVFHPGLFFKPMTTYKADKKAGGLYASEKTEDVEAPGGVYTAMDQPERR
ncbi:efflux pump himE [Physcia stellaris]|nr:efflux pump himE [Physcia stellaris]